MKLVKSSLWNIWICPPLRRHNEALNVIICENCRSSRSWTYKKPSCPGLRYSFWINNSWNVKWTLSDFTLVIWEGWEVQVSDALLLSQQHMVYFFVKSLMSPVLWKHFHFTLYFIYDMSQTIYDNLGLRHFIWRDISLCTTILTGVKKFSMSLFVH